METIAVDDLLARLRAEVGAEATPATLRAAFDRLLPMQVQAPAHADSVAKQQNVELVAIRAFINHLPLAISWFDADLNLLACNQQYKNMLNFPEEMFASGQANFTRFIRFNAERGEYGAGDPEEITQNIVALVQTNQAHVFERVRPDGTVLEIRGMPMPGGGFVTIYTDITAHKKAEQAAIRNATYLRAVIAQLPQGLTVIDENLNIVLWNRLWESNCGARPGFLYDGVTFEEAVRHLAEMGEYGGGDAAAIDEQVNMRVALAKQFQPHCFRRTRPGGKVIEIEGRTMSIDGKIAGFITMYNDITDRLAMDDLKQAKEAAEAANQMKSEFLALISHEIRTPLAGVIGMLKLVQRDLSLQAETRNLICRGEDSAQSLLAIINDLLDFSKIEAGKLSLENIDFSLPELVQDLLAMFSTHASAKHLQWHTQLAKDLPTYVLGDPIRLRQILVNLIGNAFKFTEHGGVSLQINMLKREHGMSYVRFSVEDSGIGIASDAVGRIFEKFEQADNATTRRFGGTGLGLAISRQLVELMGGKIVVQSQLGQGSVFYFELPFADGVARLRARHQVQAPHSHKLQVLCADDFVTNQIIIRMLLEEMGHEVTIVDSGEAALAAAARQHFDLILMDGRMPGMDGVTASRLIRAGGHTDLQVRDKDIYIIAVTANASESDRKFYLQAGMDDFLSKPIDEAKLHRQLSTVIERQLQRGIPLAPRILACRSELDAMFAMPINPESLGNGVGELKPLESETSQYFNAPAMHLEHDILRQMRTAFLQDVREKLVLLEQALIARNADDTGRMLHSMRGSLVYLDGTESLQRLCSQLEPEADAANWEVVEKCMPQLRQLLASCIN